MMSDRRIKKDQSRVIINMLRIRKERDLTKNRVYQVTTELRE